MLDGIDLEGDDFTRPAAFRQNPRLFGFATAEFEDTGAVERQFFEQELHFVAQCGLGGISDLHGTSGG